jgi:hypothetical protein
VALIPVAIVAASRATPEARRVTEGALVAAVVSSGLSIMAPVTVWVAVVFVMTAVYVSRRQAT